MKNTTYILIAISIILLSGCHSPLKDYPNYLRQKEYINDIVLATDYAFFKSYIDCDQPFDTALVKETTISINEKIEELLKLKGYNLSKVYNPTYFAFIDTNKIFTIKEITDTSKTDSIQVTDNSIRSNKRLNRKPKPFIIKTATISSCTNTSYNEKVYTEIFPKKSELNFKPYISKDSLIEKEMNIALLFLFKRINVSSNSIAASTLATGLVTGILTGGSMIAMSYPISYTDVYFFIIDRDNNNTIWSDFRRNKDYDDNIKNHILSEIEDIINELPSVNNNCNN